jgi:ubiquinone/menaquinone biosynthesis C-methylase UbiE
VGGPRGSILRRQKIGWQLRAAQPKCRVSGECVKVRSISIADHRVLTGELKDYQTMNTQSEDVLRAWRESAPYWEKHGQLIRMMFEPITRALIDEARITSGQTVLDVAGGTGEPSLAIAEVVGPSGSVICTDAIAEMLAAAEREAMRRQLYNVRFRQCLADSLPFESNCFDATVCRLGVMFFPDPLVSLREMLRVTKPGGHLSLAVWRGAEFNPFFRIVTEVISRYLETAPVDPQAPGAFRFAEPGKLAGVLKQAGAANIVERIDDFHIQAPITPAEFWRLRTETSDTLREKVARLSAKQLLRVAREVEAAAREFFANQQMSFPAQTIIVTGEKPK